MNALNTNFAMTILAVSENRGGGGGSQNLKYFDEDNFLYFCGPKFQSKVFEKETANCTQFRFLS